MFQYFDGSVDRAKGDELNLKNVGVANWVGNLTLTQTWLPPIFGESTKDLTQVGWTLCYEVQFYFICMLLLATVRKHFFESAAIITVIMSIAFLLQFNHGLWKADRGTVLDGRWLQFACGVLVYWTTNYASSRGARIACLLLVWVAACFAVLASGVTNVRGDLQKRCLELAVCSSFALILISLKQFDGRLAKSKIFATLGAVGVFSYSLYLVHWTLCKVVETILWRMGIRTLSGTLFITLPICFAVAISVAYVFFQFIESRYIQRGSGRLLA